MNTKNTDKNKTNPKFAFLLAHKTVEDKYELGGKIFSAKLLNEVQKICDSRDINRTTLAHLIGKTPSYITQLFTGVKNVNPELVARLEDVLKFEFQVQAKCNDVSYSEFIGQVIEHKNLIEKPLRGDKYIHYFKVKPNYNASNYSPIEKPMPLQENVQMG